MGTPGTPCSAVAAQLLCDKASKELAPGNRSLQVAIFNELSSLDKREALRGRIGDLGNAAFSARTSEHGAREEERGREKTPLLNAAVGALRSPASASQPAAALRPPSSRCGTPFFVWSPLLNKHLSVKHPAELDAARSVSFGALSTSVSLPELVALSEGSAKPSGLGNTQLSRKKEKPDPTAHLRRCPIQMGEGPMLTSTYQSACAGPLAKAVDPKWSTDLKAEDFRNSQRIKHNSRMSGAVNGAMSPEMRWLPKTYKY
ncbi:unnamed protein product [Polarella glacialis]|uniref:Uncharacterized protein n=1 Tax=Polarella glacialis TaxID=89957 RepID=A0A813FMI5_POLGL|nr:unnamed protein product [Polarella glacialis]CAE8737628.1 unnamed protein product [Polarella glacialis]